MSDPNGLMTLPPMHGVELPDGVRLIGQPSPVPGTDKLRCLADVGGLLCLVELGIKFKEAP